MENLAFSVLQILAGIFQNLLKMRLLLAVLCWFISLYFKFQI